MSNNSRISTWPYRLAVWMIMATVVIFFFRSWLGTGLPTSPRSETLAHYAYIWQIANYLRSGQLYVDWDPSFFAGYPWLRFLQYPVYYVVALLSLAPGISLPLAIKVFVIATYVVSAWMVAELAYMILISDLGDQTVAWAAATVAGIAYAIFPFHLHLGIEIISHGAFWAVLPLPFLVVERMLRQPGSQNNNKFRASYTLALGIALALYVIADIEHTVIVTPFVGLYILLRSPSVQRNLLPGLARTLLVGGLIAAGLTAFYIVPGIFELGQVGITARFGEGGTANEQFARDTGVSVGALLAALADRVGVTYRPADLPYIVFGFFGANSWYLGLATCILAILGLTWLRRSPTVAVTLILLLLSFAWAMRAWLPVNMFGWIPFFGTLSGFRGMILLGFFLSLLAGFGAARLLSHVGRRGIHVLLVLLALAVLAVDRPRATMSYAAEVVGLLVFIGFAIASAHHSRSIAVVLVALSLLGLIAVDYRTASTAVVSIPSYFTDDELEAYRWLAAQGTGFRIWEYSDLYDDAEFRHTFSVAYNAAPRFGGYYDNGAPRAQWALYKWAKPERGSRHSIEALRLGLKLSSVRYVLVHRRIATYDQAINTMKQAGFDSIAWQSANVTILEDRAWRPLAVVYSRTLTVAGGYDSELLALPAADGSHTAIVAQEGLSATSTNPGDAGIPQPAAVTRLSPYEIRVEADLSAPGMLVLSETWHPNWRVSVDGRPAIVQRVNVAFMGVNLDAGKHDVLYSYRLPRSLMVGWAATILTSLGLIAAFIVTNWRLVRSS